MMEMERKLNRAAEDILDRLQEMFDLPLDLDGYQDQAAYNAAWDQVSARVGEYLNAIPPVPKKEQSP